MFYSLTVIQIGYACNFAVRHCNCHSIRILGSRAEFHGLAGNIFVRGFANLCSLQFIGNFNCTIRERCARFAVAVSCLEYQSSTCSRRVGVAFIRLRCNRYVFDAVDSRAASRGNFFRVELNVKDNILASCRRVNLERHAGNIVGVRRERVSLSRSRRSFFAAFFATFGRFFSFAAFNSQLRNNFICFVAFAGAVNNVAKLCVKDNRVERFRRFELLVIERRNFVQSEQISCRALSFVNLRRGLSIFGCSRYNNEASSSVHSVSYAVVDNFAVSRAFAGSCVQAGNAVNLAFGSHDSNAVVVAGNREVFAVGRVERISNQNRTGSQRSLNFSRIVRRNRQALSFFAFSRFNRVERNAVNRSVAGRGNFSRKAGNVEDTSAECNFRAVSNRTVFTLSKRVLRVGGRNVATVFVRASFSRFSVIERRNNLAHAGIDEESVFLINASEINAGFVAEFNSFLPRSAFNRVIVFVATVCCKTIGILEQEVNGFVSSFSFVAAFNIVTAVAAFTAVAAVACSNFSLDKTETHHGVSAFVFAAFDCKGFVVPDTRNLSRRTFSRDNPDSTAVCNADSFAASQSHGRIAVNFKGFAVVVNFDSAAVEFRAESVAVRNGLHNRRRGNISNGREFNAIDFRYTGGIETNVNASRRAADNHAKIFEVNRAGFRTEYNVAVAVFNVVRRNFKAFLDNEFHAGRNAEAAGEREERIAFKERSVEVFNRVAVELYERKRVFERVNLDINVVALQFGNVNFLRVTVFQVFTQRNDDIFASAVMNRYRISRGGRNSHFEIDEGFAVNFLDCTEVTNNYVSSRFRQRVGNLVVIDDVDAHFLGAGNIDVEFMFEQFRCTTLVVCVRTDNRETGSCGSEIGDSVNRDACRIGVGRGNRHDSVIIEPLDFGNTTGFVNDEVNAVGIVLGEREGLREGIVGAFRIGEGVGDSLAAVIFSKSFNHGTSRAGNEAYSCVGGNAANVDDVHVAFAERDGEFLNFRSNLNVAGVSRRANELVSRSNNCALEELEFRSVCNGNRAFSLVNLEANVVLRRNNSQFKVFAVSNLRAGEVAVEGYAVSVEGNRVGNRAVVGGCRNFRGERLGAGIVFSNEFSLVSVDVCGI